MAIRLGHQSVIGSQPFRCTEVQALEAFPGFPEAPYLQKQEDSWKKRQGPLILVALTSGPLTQEVGFYDFQAVWPGAGHLASLKLFSSQ